MAGRGAAAGAAAARAAGVRQDGARARDRKPVRRALPAHLRPGNRVRHVRRVSSTISVDLSIYRAQGFGWSAENPAGAAGLCCTSLPWHRLRHVRRVARTCGPPSNMPTHLVEGSITIGATHSRLEAASQVGTVHGSQSHCCTGSVHRHRYRAASPDLKTVPANCCNKN